MDPYSIGLLIAIIVLIFLSGVFSSSETAFSTVNRARLKVLEQDGVRWAKRVNKQIEGYDKLITTILIGNNLVNIVATSLSTLFFTHLIVDGNLAVTVSTAVLTVAVLIFGEITPKALASVHPEGFLRAESLPIYWLSFVFWPFTQLFSLWKKLLVKIFKMKGDQSITEDELLTYVETAESGGGIDEHESNLIRSAIEFDDLDVGDIMVHRTNVVSIAVDAPIKEIENAYFESGYSRLPVYSETIDQVIGVLHEKDFYHHLTGGEPFEVKNVCQNTVCVSMNMKISAALRLMQKSKIHMAVVVDEYGGTAGIVTLEDIIEELVGEIYDEHDEEEGTIMRVDDDKFIALGSASLNDLFDKLEIRDDGEFESSTVGGWVTEVLEKIPLPGETFDYKNLTLTVNKATNKRVDEVAIIVHPVEED